jgi:hypothetical protein
MIDERLVNLKEKEFSFSTKLLKLLNGRMIFAGSQIIHRLFCFKIFSL